MQRDYSFITSGQKNLISNKPTDMKTIYVLCTICLLSSAIILYNFFGSYFHGNSVSLAVKETTSRYQLQLHYNLDHAEAVEKYIDSCFAPVVVFGTAHKIEKDVIINTESRFHIKADKGHLQLIADKDNNSTASLNKLRGINEGFKAVW